MNSTSGVENTAVGSSAGESNTTGERNTYLGWRAGYSNDGDANVMIGESANDQALDASNNVAIGSRVMHDNQTGNNNVAIGLQALYYAQTMAATVMVTGHQYRINNAGTTDFTLLGAANNTALTYFTYNGVAVTGNGTIYDIETPPNNNTAIGYQAGHFVGNGSGNVFLGYQAGDFAGAQGLSNKLYISNSNTEYPLIGGDFTLAELIVGGKIGFSITYNPNGTGVSNGKIFQGTDGALYFKGGSGTVSLIANA